MFIRAFVVPTAGHLHMTENAGIRDLVFSQPVKLWTGRSGRPRLISGVHLQSFYPTAVTPRKSAARGLLIDPILLYSFTDITLSKMSFLATRSALRAQVRCSSQCSPVVSCQGTVAAAIAPPCNSHAEPC